MNAPVKPPPKPPGESLPQWRLDDLYCGRDDPRIEADLAEAARIGGELAALRGGFAAARAEPGKLGALIDVGVALYERCTDKLWGVGAYASLAASTARDDAAWARFEADIRTRASQISAATLFFTLELNAL